MASHPDGGFEGRWFREQLRVLPGTEVLAQFADTGEPALVSRREGRGRSVLAAVPLGGSYHERPDNPVNKLLLALCADAGVQAPATFATAAPARTPVVREHRRGAERIFYVINSSAEPLAGSLTIPLPAGEARRVINLLDDQALATRATEGGIAAALALPAQGVAVLHLSP
jgi:hypothetical protein